HSGQHLVIKDGKIKFHEVYFSYNDKTWAIENLTLNVSPGKTLAIVGRTGAGKSTIFKLIERFYNPQPGGHIIIDDHDLRDVNLNSLRRNIAIVPQVNFFLCIQAD